jgi:hypothetical protein
MLKDEIDDAKRSVATDTVQITVGEVANMYTSNELNILPDFQRLFRWSPERKSNFVESILIGIPIPPAFVYENEDGTWELIDGLQRISTVLEFMGILRDAETQEVRRSRLIKTKYLPSLAGVVWEVGGAPISENFYERPEDDFREDNGDGPADVLNIADNDVAAPDEVIAERALDKSLQLFFRRHRIDFQILKYPSDPKTKFDLFQRLNRGGAYANEQEVRTCSMVLANADFTARLRDLAAKPEFQTIFKVTRSQRETQKDLEYAVRAVAHTFREFDRGRDVQEFLDQAIIDVLNNGDRNEVVGTIDWVVSILLRSIGEGALIPPAGLGIARRFSLRALEGIVVGLARNKGRIEGRPDTVEFVRQRVAGFWNRPEIQGMAAPGLRGTVRIQRSVNFGARWFNPDGEY